MFEEEKLFKDQEIYSRQVVSRSCLSRGVVFFVTKLITFTLVELWSKSWSNSFFKRPNFAQKVAVFKFTFLLYVLEPDSEIHTYVALCDIPSLKRKQGTLNQRTVTSP